jgi:hypothetical protein
LDLEILRFAQDDGVCHLHTRQKLVQHTTNVKVLQFFAILFVALGLAPGAAHVLELPQKMQYDAQLYMAVTSTLYRMFGIAGAVIQMGSFVLLVILCWCVRRRPAFRWTLLATLAIVLSLLLWTALVAPVNAQWGEVLRTNPSAAPALYIQLRPRWEYGHVAACVAWLAGFMLLIVGTLRERPA